MIPARNVTLLSGDGGLGKSLVALQFGIASTIGRGAIGLAPQAGRVFYLAAEDEADEFHRRADDILRHYGATFEDTGGGSCWHPWPRWTLLSSPGAGGNMKPTALMHKVVDQITVFEPDLVVLDTAADLFGGDEIKPLRFGSSSPCSGRLRWFGTAQFSSSRTPAWPVCRPAPARLAQPPGITACAAGSIRHSRSDREEITDPDARRLGQKKSNYGPRDTELRFRWQEGVFVTETGKGSNPAAGIINAQAEKVFLELLKKLSRQLQKLSPNKGPLYAPSLMARHRGQGPQEVDIAAAMQRLLDMEIIEIAEEGPPSKRRQRLVLSAADLDPSD